MKPIYEMYSVIERKQERKLEKILQKKKIFLSGLKFLVQKLLMKIFLKSSRKNL